MTQILRTRIPMHQPGGTLSVPREGWRELSNFVEAIYGGKLAVRPKVLPGFIVLGPVRGLECLDVALEIPDEVDPSTLTDGMFDVRLKALLRRSLTSQPAASAA